MASFGSGQPVRRVEDNRLLTGSGRYTDDLVLARQSHAFFLRSPHAHARIVAIDTAAARDKPGVLGVFAGADLAKAGVGPMPCMAPVMNRDGKIMIIPPRPALAVSTARFVGEPVALVIADSLAAAKDAAEEIEIDYEPLPSVVDPAVTLNADAPRIWDQAGGNLAFDWAFGDEAGTKAAMARAAKVVTLELINNRLVPNSLEPRVAIAEYGLEDGGRWTLHVSCQGGHGLRKALAEHVFRVPEDRICVCTGDVGGGFGMKAFLYPEYVGVMFAARALGRPVRWVSERAESFLADTHGRDNVTRGELALDVEGRFLALRVSIVANMGAYLSDYAPFIPTYAGAGMHVGLYTMPAALVEVRGVYTSTCPVDAYRGAGRPEASYVIERLVNLAAIEFGIGEDEIRARNLISPASLPYATALGHVYDSGDFAKLMRDAMDAADWASFPARRSAAKQHGRLRGIGMSTYVEACGGILDENAQIRFDPSGSVAVLIGNQSNGQGHETTYRQILVDLLGVPFDSIRIVQGDTDHVVYGRGTAGSRAAVVGGAALVKASERIIAKGKRLAAHLLEAAEPDIEFAAGQFRIAGTDRAMSISDVAKASFAPGKVPADMAPGLEEAANFNPPVSTFPNGCHIAEVEIDRDTGTVKVERYTIVDDFGKVINPMIVAGQVHGGTVQGIGQALHEACVYDRETGQLLTGSFMDYCMPRADDLPSFTFEYREIPCTTNPLGVKGCGEAGSIGAPPAVINAVVDALRPFGIKHIDMPVTSEKVWRAINGGAKLA
jgi:aerobic carbon-monoxide dehydrogenase large subunit